MFRATIRHSIDPPGRAGVYVSGRFRHLVYAGPTSGSMSDRAESAPAAAGGTGRPDGARLRHDLRTPVNQIVGYAEMLEEEAEDRGLGDLVPDLKKIQAAARSLLPLIERIPDLLPARDGGPEAVPA